MFSKRASCICYVQVVDGVGVGRSEGELRGDEGVVRFSSFSLNFSQVVILFSYASSSRLYPCQ